MIARKKDESSYVTTNEAECLAEQGEVVLPDDHVRSEVNSWRCMLQTKNNGDVPIADLTLHPATPRLFTTGVLQMKRGVGLTQVLATIIYFGVVACFDRCPILMSPCSLAS